MQTTCIGWTVSRFVGKLWVQGRFPFRQNFRNWMSCSIYVSRSLYQFQVHGRALRRSGVYHQMEQLKYQSEIPLLLPPKFPGFFTKWKAPQKSRFSLGQLRSVHPKKTCEMKLSARQNFVLKNNNDLHRLAEALQIPGTLKCYQGTVFLVWYWNNSREILACNNNDNDNNY